MASSLSLDDRLVEEVKELLWGSELNAEVFSRWTQGFTFSEHETTALVQHEGGPCAVLAPVQGYLLQHIIFDLGKQDLSAVSVDEARDALIQCLSKMLLEVKSSEKVWVVSLTDSIDMNNTNQEETNDSNITSQDSDNTQEQSTSSKSGDQNNGPREKGNMDQEQSDSTQDDSRDRESNTRDNTVENETDNKDGDSEERQAKRQRLDQDVFHTRLRCTKCESKESLDKCMKSLRNVFLDSYGVILFLYSVVLSKGIEQIKNEMEEPGDQLIDSVHGHGSQSLVNLFLCGKAVSNVWDNDKNVSGLKLYGIPNRTTIGFLTYVEHLRYCEVGWFLKNPCFPIWILGSETHLTVLFSKEKDLVISDSESSNAKVVFQTFDPEGNGFISTALLGDLMSALDLVSEQEYVDIMKGKLDSEDLGIITMNCFMEEFFPDQTIRPSPSKFDLYHYNGLPRSCHQGKVAYCKGQATVQEEQELQIITDLSPLLLCLQTKWPTIELQWNNGYIPSLN